MNVFNKIFVFLFSIIFVANLFSCKGDNSDTAATPNTTDNSSYFYTCKIDGVDFTSTTDAAVVSVFADKTEYYNIQGIDASGNRVTATLQSPTQTGTFETGDPDTPTQTIAAHYAQASPVANWSTRDDNGKGTIIVTENTATYMAGTYSFTAKDAIGGTTKVITEGKFKARKL